MIKRFLGSIAFLIIPVFMAVLPLHAQDVPAVEWPVSHEGSVKFIVDASMVGLEANRSKGGNLEQVLPGEIFEKPVALKTVTKEEAGLSNPFDAVSADMSAQLQADYDWMLSNFAQAEKEKVAQTMGIEDIRQRNKEILEQKGQFFILGWAFVEPYYILLISAEDNSPMPFTFVEDEGQWKRSNALSASPVFDIIFSSLQNGAFANAEE